MFKKILKNMIIIVLRIIFGICFNVKIKGKENLNIKRPYIITPNHISMLDAIFLRVFLMDQDIIYMSKEENSKIFLIGSILTYVFDLILVKRDGRDSTAIKKAYKVLDNNGILGIFPEGTRNGLLKTGSIKKGSVLIAVKKKVPIIPIGITYINKGIRKKVIINIGESLDISNIYNKRLEEVGDKEKAEEYINELLKKDIISLVESNIYENVK